MIIIMIIKTVLVVKEGRKRHDGEPQECSAYVLRWKIVKRGKRGRGARNRFR